MILRNNFYGILESYYMKRNMSLSKSNYNILVNPSNNLHYITKKVVVITHDLYTNLEIKKLTKNNEVISRIHDSIPKVTFDPYKDNLESIICSNIPDYTILNKYNVDNYSFTECPVTKCIFIPKPVMVMDPLFNDHLTATGLIALVSGRISEEMEKLGYDNSYYLKSQIDRI